MCGPPEIWHWWEVSQWVVEVWLIEIGRGWRTNMKKYSFFLSLEMKWYLGYSSILRALMTLAATMFAAKQSVFQGSCSTLKTLSALPRPPSPSPSPQALFTCLVCHSHSHA